jgi:hypothetical protein
MKITVGPAGRLVRGDVLDVGVEGFSRALKDLDPRLYVTWNPKKLRGHGCWEIRMRPSKKTSVYQGTHKGVSFYKLCDVEYDMVHHVLDCAYLNYDAIRKLREIDTHAQMKNYGYSNWEDVLVRKETEFREKIMADAKSSLKYNLQQNKSAVRDFYEAVRSGIHPGRILTAK